MTAVFTTLGFLQSHFLQFAVHNGTETLEVKPHSRNWNDVDTSSSSYTRAFMIMNRKGIPLIITQKIMTTKTYLVKSIGELLI